MSTIQDLFQQAQLAEAAYANFINSAGNLTADVDSVKTALQNEGMSITQATDFTNRYQLISQYSEPAC